MRLSFKTWARIMFCGMIMAVWPVWRWYALRTIDGSDEPWGLLALGTFAWSAVRDRTGFLCDERRFIGAAFVLCIYTLTFDALSPLPRAILAMGAFSFVLLRRQTAVASGALLSLSLPVIATAQFYLGYPLRVFAAEVSVLTLRTFDFAVSREGSLLHWRGESILVDAPCSGVRMLWLGLYLAAALATWGRLSNVRSALLLTATLALVIGANAVRATALFFKEANIVALPEWTHVGVGLLVFATAALLIVRLAQAKETPPCCA